MPEFDAERYAQLLADARPAVIETEEEHERLLSLAEGLMERGDASLSAEDRKLLELVVLLVESFERAIEADDEGDEDEDGPPAEQSPPKPHEILRRLLDARGLDTADIVDFFGNAHIAGEALSGMRPISRGQAKQLANFFRVPAKLFNS